MTEGVFITDAPDADDVALISTGLTEFNTD